MQLFELELTARSTMLFTLPLVYQLLSVVKSKTYP